MFGNFDWFDELADESFKTLLLVAVMLGFVVGLLGSVLLD